MEEICRNRNSIIKQPVQSSHWEPYLLCFECDNERIGNIEGYVNSKFFFPLIEYSKKIQPPEGNVSKVFTADYQRIKLFLLSLLWRMSITNDPKHKVINLGKHSDILRKMILENNPKEIYDYPFIFYSFINSKNYNDPDSYIRTTYCSPVYQKVNHGYEYAILIPGFLFIIRISELTNKLYVEWSYKGNDKIAVYFPPEKDSKELVTRFFKKTFSN